MTQFENFPKKCIKCKRSDIELHKFTYGRTKRKLSSKSSITRYISFPVCSSCRQAFEKSYKVENVFESMKYVSLISFLIAIYTGIELLRGSTFWLISLILIITTSLTIISIALYVKIKVDPNRIRNYINLKKTGEVSIIDKKFQQEVVEHIVSEKEEEALKRIKGIGMIICPKCDKNPSRMVIIFCTYSHYGHYLFTVYTFFWPATRFKPYCNWNSFNCNDNFVLIIKF